MKLSLVINAIGHPIRREIINHLRKSSLSAGDLSRKFDVTKPTMSVHFKILKEANLIYSNRDGNHIIYHLNTTVAEEALVLIAGLLGPNTKESLK